MSQNEQEIGNVAVGPMLVGIFLVGLTIWSLYNGIMEFAYLNVILMVVLTLGAAIINKKY